MVPVLFILWCLASHIPLVLMENRQNLRRQERLQGLTMMQRCQLKPECDRFLQVETMKALDHAALLASVIGRKLPVELQETIDIDRDLVAFLMDYQNYTNSAGFNFFVNENDLKSTKTIFMILMKLGVGCQVIVMSRELKQDLSLVDRRAETLNVVLSPTHTLTVPELNEKAIKHEQYQYFILNVNCCLLCFHSG